MVDDHHGVQAVVLTVGIAVGVAGMLVPLVVADVPWWLFFGGVLFLAVLGRIDQSVRLRLADGTSRQEL